MKGMVGAILGLLTLGTVVGLMAWPGTSTWSQSHTQRMRGRDAYYDRSESAISIDSVTVRLAGDEDVFLKLGYTCGVRRGRELTDGGIETLFALHNVHLRNALLIELSEFDVTGLETREGKLALKRWLKDLTQSIIFPKEEARIENVWIEPFFLQRVARR
jgi:flagellar basal body-associated protein FliL